MKKVAYLFFSGIFGMMLVVLSRFIIELAIFQSIVASGAPIDASQAQRLVPLEYWIALLLLGFMLGVRIGFFWWRVVYVEKRHWSWKKS